MKKTLTLIASLLLTMAAGAQTVNVHMTDGTVVNYPAANVSYIDFTAEGVVAVDLGLPSGTKWANMNVGATKPEEYGLYFAWGETVGFTSDTSDGHNFVWEAYKWCNGNIYSLTKYCTDGSYGTVDMKSVLELKDDAAHVNWGGSWVMPTIDDMAELLDNTTSEWTTVNGIYGRKFTSKTNGNSVFLPAAGSRGDARAFGLGLEGEYWSASLYKSDPSYVCFLGFHSNAQRTDYIAQRRDGLTVRPVIRN